MKKVKLSNKQQVILSFSVAVILTLGLVAALYLSSRPQDIRQQAASCSDSPVNVQFRKSTGKDYAGWKEGADFKDVKVGDSFDVNCFSRNGAALLRGGKFTVKLDGKSESISSSYLKTATEFRGWEIDEPGFWAFTCSNGSGCTNTDAIKVIGEKIPTATATPIASPSPSALASPAPTGNCSNAHVSDLNNDCRVDLLDYDIFLEDFSDNFSE